MRLEASAVEEIIRRGVKPLHAFVALMLAALREFGVINFGVVHEVTKQVGEKMALIYGRGSSPSESLEKAASLLEVGQFEVVPNQGNLLFMLKSSTCRVCPKGVGGLELPGKLCPLVGLLAGFSGMKAEEARKEGSYCVMEFKA